MEGATVEKVSGGKAGGGPAAPQWLLLVALLAGNVALALGPWSVRLADSGPVSAAFWRLALALHSPQVHGFFDVPLDHLTSQSVLVKYFRQQGLDDTIVVSPDVGYAKQAIKLAAAMGVPLAVGTKVRHTDTEVEIETVLGVTDPPPKRAIVIDDEIATGGTMVQIVEALNRIGIERFTIASTHGLFTGDAVEKLNALDCVDEIVTTDTVYAPHAVEGIPKLVVQSVASVLGDAILCNHEGRSVGDLFAFWEKGAQENG